MSLFTKVLMSRVLSRFVCMLGTCIADGTHHTSKLSSLKLTICPTTALRLMSRLRRNRYQVSVATRWQLASRWRLFWVTFRPTGLWTVRRNLNHFYAMSGLHRGWAATSQTSPTIRQMYLLAIWDQLLSCKILLHWRRCLGHFLLLLRMACKSLPSVPQQHSAFLLLHLFLWGPSAYSSRSTSALWLIYYPPYWTFQLSPPVPRCYAP
jgi:hypothetical protein